MTLRESRPWSGALGTREGRGPGPGERGSGGGEALDCAAAHRPPAPAPAARGRPSGRRAVSLQCLRAGDRWPIETRRRAHEGAGQTQGPPIIGLTGPNAAGKGEAARFLREKGYAYHSLSDVVREEATARGLDHSRENLIRVGNELRQTFGAGILASGSS